MVAMVRASLRSLDPAAGSLRDIISTLNDDELRAVILKASAEDAAVSDALREASLAVAEERVADGIPVAPKTASTPSAAARGGVPAREWSSGFIFTCRNDTLYMNFERWVMGLPAHKLEILSNTLRHPPTALFLFDTTSRRLHGIYEPAGDAGLYLDPHYMCFHGETGLGESPFPAQVRFSHWHAAGSIDERHFCHLLQYIPATNTFRQKLSAEQTTALVDLFGRGDVLATHSLPYETNGYSRNIKEPTRYYRPLIAHDAIHQAMPPPEMPPPATPPPRSSATPTTPGGSAAASLAEMEATATSARPPARRLPIASLPLGISRASKPRADAPPAAAPADAMAAPGKAASAHRTHRPLRSVTCAIEGMFCGGCVAKVEAQLAGVCAIRRLDPREHARTPPSHLLARPSAQGCIHHQPTAQLTPTYVAQLTLAYASPRSATWGPYARVTWRAAATAMRCAGAQVPTISATRVLLSSGEATVWGTGHDLVAAVQTAVEPLGFRATAVIPNPNSSGVLPHGTTPTPAARAPTAASAGANAATAGIALAVPGGSIWTSKSSVVFSRSCGSSLSAPSSLAPSQPQQSSQPQPQSSPQPPSQPSPQQSSHTLPTIAANGSSAADSAPLDTTTATERAEQAAQARTDSGLLSWLRTVDHDRTVRRYRCGCGCDGCVCSGVPRLTEDRGQVRALKFAPWAVDRDAPSLRSTPALGC